MKTYQLKSGSILHKTGDKAEHLELILSGKVEITAASNSIIAKRGAILGVFEHAGNPYSYDYIAKEDCILEVYPYTRLSDANQILVDHFSSCDILVTAAAGLVMSLSSKYNSLKKRTEGLYSLLISSYEEYKRLCTQYQLEVQSFPIINEIEAFVPEKDVPEWLGDYYDQLEIMPRETKMEFFGAHTSLSTAAILEATGHAHMFLALIEQLNSYANELISSSTKESTGDFYDLYVNLWHSGLRAGIDSTELKISINVALEKIVHYLENNTLLSQAYIDSQLPKYNNFIGSKEVTAPEDTTNDSANRYQVIENSLDTILKYTSLDEAEEDRFRKLIAAYQSLKDKNSSEESVRLLRLEISKTFFDIYETALLSSFESSKTPVVLKMFFCFGYIDENLIGRDNALLLYQLASTLNYAGKEHVYTIYDWLRSIYDGTNEPSKNEFDQNYPAYIRSQRQDGYLSEEMEKRYLVSPKEKLRFELNNFFRVGMKIATGHPTTFCPLISEHNIVKPLINILVTPDNIRTNWNAIRNVDYSCFYRESSYQSPEYHIVREQINQEVLPDVILMPTIGSRSSLWQETANARRDSAARMILPIFSNEDLELLQMKLAGEFRWEICKKIQGSRWNDVTDHSLTSEYFDYLQFYRKNPDLSADAKEKIKTAISNCKNNFRNVFVSDYILWIKYESTGSPRLNKVSKNILFTYCPFSASIRQKLASNPMYSDQITRHEAKAARQLRLLSNHYEKTKNAHGGLPEEINRYLSFFTL